MATKKILSLSNSIEENAQILLPKLRQHSTQLPYASFPAYTNVIADDDVSSVLDREVSDLDLPPATRRMRNKYVKEITAYLIKYNCLTGFSNLGFCTMLVINKNESPHLFKQRAQQVSKTLKELQNNDSLAGSLLASIILATSKYLTSFSARDYNHAMETLEGEFGVDLKRASAIKEAAIQDEWIKPVSENGITEYYVRKAKESKEAFHERLIAYKHEREKASLREALDNAVYHHLDTYLLNSPKVKEAQEAIDHHKQKLLEATNNLEQVKQKETQALRRKLAKTVNNQGIMGL